MLTQSGSGDINKIISTRNEKKALNKKIKALYLEVKKILD